MTGSKDKYGVSFKDVVALIAGDISDEKRRQLAKAIYDPDHPLSYLARQASHGEPFVSDWPPAVIPPAIQELLHQPDAGKAVKWMSSRVDFEPTSRIADLVLSVVHSIAQELELQPLVGFAKGNEASSVTDFSATDLKEHLEEGKPVIASDDARWLHLLLRDQELVVRAGENSAILFAEFTVTFRRSGDALLRLESSRGEVNVSGADFEAVTNCDEIVIQPKE